MHLSVHLAAVISNNVDCVLALLEAGAQIPPFDPSPPYTSAAPRPRRKRTPLDLAQSRLDMLIRARVEERRVSSDEDDEMDVEEPGISAKEDDIMGQVIKIIRLLKHFIRAPTPTMSISSTPHASATDPFSELDALTDQLSRIQLRASSSAQEENENENEVGVLRRLKEVVEGLQI
ncbi:hypothetical protein BC938DRAFT_472027 [Jimgerdemannia flammicorona]|uniref:Ankyrin repeat-containing domain protein n=1 Tax=Jimgerdemannia flammicorona TaxID=994334 RepID=A0A433QUD4_9FUNG|nr:hypothetical protein BC938DRAFT_472027 [Jimgerdemannia flammicorona]